MNREFYIIGTATVLIGCVFFAYRSRVVRETDSIQRAFRLYQLHLAAIGALLGVVWITLASPSHLASTDSFGLAANIKSPEELQAILQSYNRALQRTAAALNWFLLTFVVWFLLNTYRFCATLARHLADRDKP